eukprot:CAMPEP_0172298404 /NCGR_PEP_ID=MMETSP1058-20130122/1079_1 /TAXON_ID=83371 /ORGANISM="Detonula confervacea, Strain CCMP 353" /LENGTH=1052 /DNA_ID=CAMNT_0013007679 /DNA_START=26 /DNA_END=3184 /DNA_ORIENTATION=-
MKFTWCLSSWLLASLRLDSVAAASSHLRGIDKSDASSNIHDRVLKEDEEGEFVVAHIQYEHIESRRGLQGNSGRNTNDQPDEMMTLVMDSGLIYTLEGVDPNWRRPESGKARVSIGAGATVKSNGRINLNGGMPSVVGGPKKPKKNKDHPIFGRDLEGTPPTEEQQANLENLRRQLQDGTRSVLAVRINHTGSGAKGNTSADAATIANNIFGDEVGGNDPVNLHSQYEACSHGKFLFKPAPNQVGNSGVSIVDGVVEVTASSTDCTDGGCDGALRTEASNILLDAFGQSVQNLATHVMFCVPPGSMSGIAYAGVNSWYSVYSDKWCQYVSVQLHEIGHNLGYGHSNENGSYKDQSGMMGYSYGQSDSPIMCFNGPKSWKAGWYSDRHTVFNQQDLTWAGQVFGQADYPATNEGDTVLLKLNTASSTDYYVQFNRKIGNNSGTNEGGNQVLVTRAGGEGTSYSESELLAKLNAGGSFSLENFDNSGFELRLTVNSINLSATPAYADITVQSGCVSNADCNTCGGETCGIESGVCEAGTPLDNCCGNGVCEAGENPISCPSECVCSNTPGYSLFEVEVITDNYPGETSWSLKNMCTGNVMGSKAQGSMTTTGPQPDAQFCVENVNAELEFTISDTYGDGVCCSYGLGSYKVKQDGVVMISGGEFASTEIESFGSCGPPPATPNPTNNPTSLPTSNPTTPLPTANPTTEPTNPMTTEPTANPTPSPTPSPTPNPTTADPTPSPTPNPTTANPTPSPTPNPTTAEPTPSPTPSPTPNPTTANPTPNPTTANPTNASTPNPTNAATPNPTSAAPTTLPPTPTGGALVATFVPSLGVLKCSAIGASCTSGLLLDGTANNNEPNPPNTLDSCTDGPYGSYHYDESIDKITVAAVGGGQLQAGSVAEIQAQVYAWSSGSADTADFYYAAAINTAPVWTLIGSLPAGGAGLRTLTVQYTLPAGADQAVRVNFRYGGSQNPCSGGSWDDVDDLAFSVGTTSSMVAGALKSNPVPELHPLQSSICADIGSMLRCDAVPVCKWQSGNGKGKGKGNGKKESCSPK